MYSVAIPTPHGNHTIAATGPAGPNQRGNAAHQSFLFQKQANPIHPHEEQNSGDQRDSRADGHAGTLDQGHHGRQIRQGECRGVATGAVEKVLVMLVTSQQFRNC
jgi:hypothetical protein